MPIPQEALDLENQSIGINGESTLGKAFEILKERWQAGDRDREIGLHLFFLAWYGLVEPENNTGFSEAKETGKELNAMLADVHRYFEPTIEQDAEILYVVGLTSDLFWFMLDDSKMWEQRGINYKYLYRKLMPYGIDPEIFRNRGAYGQYFEGHARLEGGY